MLRILLLQIETAVEARLELLEHCLAPDLELDEAILGRVHKGIDAIEALTRDDFAKACCFVSTLACGATQDWYRARGCSDPHVAVQLLTFFVTDRQSC